jgi:hypothetical protein
VVSSFPDEVSASLPHPRPVPLGRLLIERGLLSEQQLVEALLEQNRTGDRLGQVLIRLGFVEAPTVAMALATQHGGPLKTEYGFATGFPGEPAEPGTEPSETPEPAASEAHAPELHLAEAADPEPEEPEKDAEPPAEGESARPTAPTEDRASSQIAAALSGLHAIQAELEAADTRIADLERELAAAQEKLDADHTRVAELEEELEATRERLDGQRSRTAELEEKVARDRAAAETAIAALRELTGASS